MKLTLSTDFKYEKSQRNRSLEIEEHYFIPKLVGYMVFAEINNLKQTNMDKCNALFILCLCLIWFPVILRFLFDKWKD